MKIFDQVVGDLKFFDGAFSCSEDTTVQEVISILAKRNIGSIVITDEKKIPIGIFTERDLLRKICIRLVEHNGQDPIRMYMTHKPVVCHLNTGIGKVMGLMRLGKFRHLVVVNEDGTFYNVISVKDIMEFLSDQLKALEDEAA